jgi:cation diffusion facilitator CzcD-associated flavoprotein CzcO
MPETEIVIIGGGPAGLTSAGALKQAGLEAILLEQGERAGQSWEQRYDRLHLHTVRAYSGLAHFPIPSSYPNYLSKEQYAAYLRDYAAHFGLKVLPRRRVNRVRAVDWGGQPMWAVESETEAWLARVVVIATGQFGQPVYPVLPGLAKFGGITLHSGEFHSGQAFQNQRVLVIAAGNSGMEIAVDLAEQGAAWVGISQRSVPPVVPRDFLGTPAQVFAILMHAFPPGISDRVGSVFSRLAFGDLKRYGLPEPGWRPFSSRRTPVIDAGFVAALKAGKVHLRPGVSSVIPGGVIYPDQREETFDALIFATGFRAGLEDLLEPDGLLDAHGNPRFASGSPTDCPGLYFMGFFDSLRGFLYESNLASQRLAGEIKRYLAG